MGTVISSKIVKARKRHVCELCGGEIKKGEKYKYLTITDGGTIYNFHSHLHCDALIYDIFDPDDYFYDGVDMNMFCEALYERIDTLKIEYPDKSEMLDEFKNLKPKDLSLKLCNFFNNGQI